MASGQSSTDQPRGANNLTGYGPSIVTQRPKLHFDGDDLKYELWIIKFHAYLRLQNLLEALNPNYVPADGAEDKNERVYAELVQFLDDKSLSLIIREAKDDGRAALKILERHYAGNSKPRVIGLYVQLTTLKLKETETATDYILRTQRTADALVTAGENISDSLLIAMAIKGLSEKYSAFVAVMTQKEDQQTFGEFKKALRSFEETLNGRHEMSTKADSVMKMENTKVKKLVCYSCGKEGHKKFQCKIKATNSNKKYCNNCKMTNHNTNDCRRINSAKVANDEGEASSDFIMKIDTDKKSINDTLLVDCGATSHIIIDKSKFVDFDKDFNPATHFIELADGKRKNNIATGRGKARVMMTDNKGVTHNVILKDALCVPSYTQNILSVKAATRAGARVNFSREYSELVLDDGKVTFNLECLGNLYYVNNVKHLDIKSRSLKEWHKAMGHCNIDDLIKLESVVEGMKISDKSKFNCVPCIKGKMTQHFNRKPDIKANKILDLVHCDLTGMVKPAGMGDFKYGINFVDDYSGVIHLYLIKNKNDAHIALEQFIADVAPFGIVKCIRSDCGTEFTGKNFKDVLRQKGIAQQFSAPYSPHQNGTAERSWRSIFEATRCLLAEANLPKELWPYAAKYAVYIRNRCFSRRLNMTPYEAFTGRKPNIGNMHIFGETCFSYEQEKKKLDDRCKEGKFIGFDGRSKAYQVYYPENNSVKKVRCVNFLKNYSEEGETYPEEEEEEEYFIVSEGAVPEKQETKKFDESMKGETSKHEMKNDEKNVKEKTSRRYPKRERKVMNYKEYSTSSENSDYSDSDYCYYIKDVPRTFKEAASSENSAKWIEAMKEELNSLKESDTFKYTKLPEGKTPIGCKWVYTIKGGEKQVKYKARLVAKGFNQKEGVDFTETFSPTAKLTSLRTLVQLAAVKNYEIHQLDVKSAYLNADIDAEIYLNQPEGFQKSDDKGDKLYWKLNKSLYGLKQSGRNWNKLLDEFLTQQKFNQSKSDHCIYTKHDGHSNVIMLIWVDDILVASNSKQSIKEVKDSLNSKFKMKDLGQISTYLGIDFEVKDEYISMSQTNSIKGMLEKFNMADCKPKLIPCDPSSVNMKDCDSELLEDPNIYQQIVGSLIYIMTCTRPDICYPVTKLSQFMKSPTYAHLNLAKHVLRYLKGTMHYNLKYYRSNTVELYGYSDSDWGGSEDRKSISGYNFKLCENSSLISWKSKKQNSVALSSCEAEFIALTVAAQEAKFLNQLLIDLNENDQSPVKLFVDNQGAMALAKNPVFHQRSKHIDIKYHFIRDEIAQNNLNVQYVPTNYNIADTFTKPMSGVKLKHFKNMIFGV